jgi:hypothetical protein
MRIKISPNSLADYRTFLGVKQLPIYRIAGEFAEFPDEYASRLGMSIPTLSSIAYDPSPRLFDYQRDIADLAIRKRKFAVFADCGLGKTLIFLEFARHTLAQLPPGKCALIVSPLMVVTQTISEARRFGEVVPEKIPASGLREWLESGQSRFGITNYEAIRDEVKSGRLGCLILDESSMLKSHYGKWGTSCIRLGRGLDWKLACTGTPAPNDRIEYANHAVFLDQEPTTNSFLARYFVNRGQTGERWELKRHALEPFYRSLSHWCIFLTNPATYGWKDNVASVPPIHVHIHNVELTTEQQGLVWDRTGTFFGAEAGGIGKRSMLAQIAKGRHGGQRVETRKPAYIRKLIESWPGESTIIWCLYNHEQDLMEGEFPDAGSIRGETPYEKRMEIIESFKSGELRVLISKPKVLGFGLNLQIATRQVFSGLQDSYESFYQAVKRSNRIGSKLPLNVHIPVTSIEMPMIETVLKKAKMVQADTEMQEQIFRRNSNVAT